VGERPQTIQHFAAARILVRGRRSVTALILAATLAACSGSSGPAALSVHCTGHRLAGPDTTSVSPVDVPQPVAPAAISGVPHLTTAPPPAEVPEVLDPADPRYGYSNRDWDIVRTAAIGGPDSWSATIRLPGGAQASQGVGYSPDPYGGYLIVRGGRQGRYLAAVSDQGQAGPACALPPYDATDGTVDLLPHAGVVVAANPAAGAPSTAKDIWLNGYSTTTGKRLWSADTHTSANESVDLVVSGDSAYIWQEYTGKIAAYDARTGHQSWQTDSGTVSLLGGDNRLLGATDGRVYALAEQDNSSRVEALNGTTGQLIWKRDVPEPAGHNQISLSQLGTGLVAVAGAGSKDYLLDAADGSIVSSMPVQLTAALPQPCSVFGNPAVAVVEDGAIGVLSSDQADNRTIAIAPGRKVTVAVASTMAYVRAEQPGAPVSGYDLGTGTRRWTLPLPRTSSYVGLEAFSGGFAAFDGRDSQTFT
jgi:hypothetical protein